MLSALASWLTSARGPLANCFAFTRLLDAPRSATSASQLLPSSKHHRISPLAAWFATASTCTAAFSGKLVRRLRNNKHLSCPTGARHHSSTSTQPPLQTAQHRLRKAVQATRSGDLKGAAALLDELTATDLGLSPSHLPAAPAIGYQHIYEDQDLSVGIFMLPKGTSIPLHDHPQMTVLSKLLFGKLDVVSFDMPSDHAQVQGRHKLDEFGLLKGRHPRKLHCGPCKREVLEAPAPTEWLHPLQGNIHQFTALEDCAILDILTPPYEDAAGRSCHYYKVMEPAAIEASSIDEHRGRPFCSVDDEGEVDLVEVAWPIDLQIVQRRYKGPSVK